MPDSSLTLLRREWPLILSVVTTALFYVLGERWFADLSGALWFSFLLAWLFAAILISAFAVVMIVMNGMVGLALVLGGLRHHEQNYNLQGANAFLAVIVPLAVLCLVLPNFTVASPGPSYSALQSAFLVIMSLVLYGVFLAIQNLRHRDYFIAPGSSGQGGAHVAGFRSIPFHGVLLIAHLLPRGPAGEAARGADQLRHPRAPSTGRARRSAGLDPINVVLLVLTLAVSTLTFASTRTNVLQGAVHLLLFVAYLMMIFDR